VPDPGLQPLSLKKQRLPGFPQMRAEEVVLPIALEPSSWRVTHRVGGWRRAAEIVSGVVCIEGHQVTSLEMLTKCGVMVIEIDSFDTMDVSQSQLERAASLARRTLADVETERHPSPAVASRQTRYFGEDRRAF
jgi:hypothetical protein